MGGGDAANEPPAQREGAGKRTDEVSGVGGGPVLQNRKETEPAPKGLRFWSRPGKSRKTSYDERPRSTTLGFQSKPRLVMKNKLMTQSSLPKSGDEVQFPPCARLPAAPPPEQTTGPRAEPPRPGSRVWPADAPLPKAPQVCNQRHRLASTGGPWGRTVSSQCCPCGEHSAWKQAARRQSGGPGQAHELGRSGARLPRHSPGNAQPPTRR